MSFPRQVNVQPAVAVAGDFASTNTNKFTVIAGGVGGFSYTTDPVVGATIAAFCWADPTNSFVSSHGAGTVTGFISRQGMRADIVTPGPGYPDSSNTILPGSFIQVFNAGDFYVTNSGATTSAIGNKAYANFTTGLVTFAASGSPPAAAAITSGSVTANTLNVSTVAVNAFTGSIAPAVGATPAVLTVSAITTGGLYPGQTIAGTGVDPNTTVLAQLTGTAGSTGTYSVSISQTIASEAMTGSGGWLTVTSMTNGVVFPGQTLSGGSNAFAAGTTVLVGGTGTGVAGTYPVSIAQTLASTATATGSGGYFTATTLTAGGRINPGDTMTSASGSAYFLPFGTGGTTGVGLGGGTTYVLSNASEAGDTSGFTVAAGVETKWYCYTPAAPGELAVISSTPPG